jgi:CheY-like chemotaxis protein
MENPLILVTDADPKNLQILQDSLESSGFSVIIAEDGLRAWEIIQSEQPDLILSEVNLPNYDGFQLLEKLKEDPRTSVIPIMFLTNRRDIQDRVRSLRGGVKDYLIKPLHVKEVIARIRMILRRMERVKSEDTEASKKMVGRLEESGIVELIDNFGSERKTGVLQLYNEQNRNGEIWFKNGAVVHASFGTLKSEKAVYQMLPWRQGHFIMTFKEVQIPETINVSNLGLLLHGYKRMELREQLMKQLPSPETTFVLSESFRKVISRKEFSQEASKFIALIDGRRDIMQILEESVYDDIQSLERLVKLYKEGFIKPGKAPDQDSTEINIASPTGFDELDNLQDENGIIFEEEQNVEYDISVNEPIEKPVSTTRQDTPSSKDFPPPDYDALDDEKSEQEIVKQKDIFQSGRTPSPFKKEDSFATHSKEFDDIKPHPNESLQSSRLSQFQNLQVEQSEQKNKENLLPPSDINRDEILTDDFENEIDAQDHHRFPTNVPEPLVNAEFSPGADISKALNEQIIEESEDLAGAVNSPVEQPDLQRISHEENEDTEQEAIATFTNKAQVPEPDAKKPPYSFPLRSYGKPRIENKSDASHDSAEQVHSESKHEDRLENGLIRENIDYFSQPQKSTSTPNEQERKALPPKLQQTQKAGLKINLSQPQSKRVAQKSFTDLDHLIQRQHEQEAQLQTQNQAPAFPTKKDEHVSAEKNALLVDFFERNQIDDPKFVLIGSNKKFIHSFATFLIDDKSLKESKSAIFEYFAAEDSQLDNSKKYSVIGVTMEKQFTHLLDKIAASLAGYVLLIDASDNSKLEYISYLYKSLEEKYNRPCGIVIYDGENGRNYALDTIKDLIGAETGDLVMKLGLHDAQDHLHFLREMLNEKKKDIDYR